MSMIIPFTALFFCHLSPIVKSISNIAHFIKSFQCDRQTPHEKINRCLTDINLCLTDIFKI